MGSQQISVTDESSRAEVAEAMIHVNAKARMTPAVIGTSEEPSAWDRRHRLLDAMLTDWETRPA